jgi:hypothetical protein
MRDFPQTLHTPLITLVLSMKFCGYSYVGLVPRPIERGQDGLVHHHSGFSFHKHHTMTYLTVFDLYFIIIISFCHVKTEFWIDGRIYWTRA